MVVLWRLLHLLLLVLRRHWLPEIRLAYVLSPVDAQILIETLIVQFRGTGHVSTDSSATREIVNTSGLVASYSCRGD